MQTKTKVPLTLDEVQNLVLRDISSDRSVLSMNELTDGWFNMAYAITLSNPEQKLVLKVAPPPSLPVQMYERNGMEIEVRLLTFFNSNKIIPVPKLIASELDPKKSIIGRKYFWMEYFEGIPLNRAGKSVDKDTFNKFIQELAVYQKAMNDIQGEWFGMYWDPEQEHRYSSWFECLQGLFGWLISDYSRFRTTYPQEIHEIPGLLNEFKWAFDEIARPKLVHWDLWEGNVFVGQSNGEWKIIGITDFERALWGDPLMEILFFQSRSKDLFISHYDPNILKSKAAQVRRTFYNIYFAMIIFIETTVRSYPKLKQIAIRMYGKAIYRTSIKRLKKLANQAKT